MHMKAFLHFLKKLLNYKYPYIDFDCYLTHCAQNVHMGLNYSLLTLHEYEQIISDIEKLWLVKRHDMKFKFILPQLTYTVKWKLTISYLEKILKMAAIEYKTYSSNAHISKRAYQGSAGCNLLAPETKVLKPWDRVFIKVDFIIAIPEGYCGWIVGSFGLASTCSIVIHNGTIDSDY